MKLYLELLKAVFNKFIVRKNTGEVVLDFCENMGIVYIKLAQILATQNIDNIFNEIDRKSLSSICDSCQPISFEEIINIVESEYNCKLNDMFSFIDSVPIGSASISQVHRATLKNGEIVAVKVKRVDVTSKMEEDINQIRKLIHRFGKIFSLRNLIGSDNGLELYLRWIKEETDFDNERINIKKYQEFASLVNGKVENAKEIKVPKVYEELCTDNIIVMEYISSPTVNQLPLTEENKGKIRTAINSYIQASFYALLHGYKVSFHGDPHSGNIYIDEKGNIGFLDMGLLFCLDEKETKLTEDLFLSSYLGNSEKLYDLIVSNARYTNFDEKSLREDLNKHVKRMKKIPVASFFIKMIMIFTKYNVTPPDVTFKLAKAFLCLYGMTCFSQNIETTDELLKKQITEFYVERTLKDTKQVVISGLTVAPKMIQSIFKYGLQKGIIKEATTIADFNEKCLNTLRNCKEVLNLYMADFETPRNDYNQSFSGKK